jgi:hypothetical protein
VVALGLAVLAEVVGVALHHGPALAGDALRHQESLTRIVSSMLLYVPKPSEHKRFFVLKRPE